MKKLYIELITSGYNPLKDQIIKIEALMDHGDGTVSQFSRQIKPDKLLQKEAKFLVGRRIFQEQLDTFSTSASVFSEFVEWLGTFIDVENHHTKVHLCGYNSTFHAAFLRKWFLDSKAKFYDKFFWSNTLDLMVIASYIFAGYRDSLTSFSMVNICHLLTIKTKDEHDISERVINLVLLHNALDNYVDFKPLE